MLDNNLRLIRIEGKISQTVASEAINVSRSTYGMYEAGLRVPDIETVYKLAKFFGVPMEYIYSDDPTSFTDAVHLHMHMTRMEKELILNYRYLNAYSKGRVLERCQSLLEEQRMLNSNVNREKIDRERYKKRHEKRMLRRQMEDNKSSDTKIPTPLTPKLKDDKDSNIKK